MMGRILIVFDTKGGSTGEITQWISEGAASGGAQVDVQSPNAVTSLDYDLIVVGSPIYDDKPMASVRRFLGTRGLHNKKLALFVVCGAGIFGMKSFMVRKYLEELREMCAGVVIRQTSFDSAMGRWRNVNRAVCIDFGKELASLPRKAAASSA